ncbi:MAG TPA: PfkB family carbohydrate kinase [Methylomirabilota bacterium]|nr:PfkB family carbohydrate kinase [Methylomirabilota bacterium]
MLPLRRLRELIPALAGKRVVVVGDIIADEYLYGKPARISREAPVLILRFTDREVRLGGAANATDNVRALGAVATPVGVVGRDEAGQELTRLFTDTGISTDGVMVSRERATPVKTRIMAGGYESTRQQVVRLDREPEATLPDDVERGIVERVKAAGARADAFLLSDYGYGTVTSRVFETVSEIARRRDLLVTVDSRYDLPRFRGVTAATPNEPEVEELASAELGDEPSLEKAGRAVLERLEARYLLITRGSRGMALLEREGPVTWIPIHGSDQIADVTGAGDTVISAFTTALAAGAAPAEAAWLANVAGGVVVMKRGTAAATPRELLESLAGDDTASRS